MAKQIPLTRGAFALVDDKDYDYLNRWSWYYSPDGYAARGDRSEGKLIRVLMHRQLMEYPSSLVDHKNGNGIDNQRGNLRLATKAQNAYNSGPQKTNTSGYKGVSFCKVTQKWRASITLNGKSVNLGRYSTPEEAARAYDRKAKEGQGEFARLNFG